MKKKYNQMKELTLGGYAMMLGWRKDYKLQLDEKSTRFIR